MIEAISTCFAPKAIGPYSQGVQTSSLLFCSGQLPVDPVSGQMPQSAEEQARQSLRNVQSVLEASGCSLDSVVKVTIFLADMTDFSAVNEAYAAFFKKPYPARSCFAVAALPKNAKLEIEAIAAK